MAQDNENWLDQTGLNLIRIIIGSYFAGVSLDLIEGFDQSALFLPLLDAQMADLAGSTLLFFVSVIFMTGIGLRLSSLSLAILVLCSSTIENFAYFELGNISAFWRDLALICGVLLNYVSLNQREIEDAAVLGNTKTEVHISKLRYVSPRRVSPDKPPRREIQREIRERLEEASSYATDHQTDAEVDNIFSDPKHATT